MASQNEKLMAMKKEIEQAKTKSAEYEGQLKSLRKRLQEEFGCKDLASAEKKLDKMDQELGLKEKELEKGMTKLEQDYEWGG